MCVCVCVSVSVCVGSFKEDLDRRYTVDFREFLPLSIAKCTILFIFPSFSCVLNYF